MYSSNFGQVIVPDTNATGGLRTTGDTVAAWKPGSVTVKVTDDGVQTFVYMYAESTLTGQKATMVFERGGVLGGMAAAAMADSTSWNYIGAPAASITSTKYGWVQIEGPVTAMAGLVSEARTAGNQLDLTQGTLADLSSAAGGTTIASVCGYIRVANTASSTTGNIHLHGNRVLGHT
jgi:hypothetical protein